MGRSTVVILLMAAIAGCGAEAVSDVTAAEPDGGQPDDPSEATLEVDAPSLPTFWTSVPVTGHGPPNGTLNFTSAGSGQFTEKLSGTGDFCVDVLLTTGIENKITFTAVAADGTHTDPVVINVRQEGSPPDTGPGTEPKPGYSNIVAGAEISSMTVTVEEGDIKALVDGDSSGAVSIQNVATSPDWIVLELNERLPIQQIHIESTADCPLEGYKILLHDGETSAPPVEYNWLGQYVYGDGWTLVGVVEDGSSDETIVPSIGDPRAKRMAIEFRTNDCGSALGRGLHRITEIEVWGRGANAVDEPGTNKAPSCDTL